MEKRIAVAIDGPAAAGKSTVAKIVAEKLSYIYIDTGAMYRALTLKALKQQLDLKNESKIEELLLHTIIELNQKENRQIVLLDGEDVTEEIRNQEVTNYVSYIAKIPTVREQMVLRQQKLAENRGVVMDGRDIGTHVLPDAEVKIFLIASVEERAMRRYEENKRRGIFTDLEELKEDIKKRDEMDMNREVSPLIKADDAVEVDTTSLTIDEVVQEILNVVSSYLKEV
ncbi:(d)CMP kinase [Oceanobacillus caeni]|uniref:Cytidylate kinase n=1 Tax=Oceanobacillus caeni TaxID=405946 RepID=A0ABR5MF82_9BACI|nr:(d)CMP kinase [Oceanobacillus caeni]KKE79445.1 cytidylate kinase [Bacilli bacterium VT-13-104]PZD88420.1 (d)CMP kinase [Bacilli bacterium]KPH69347.1 cytidylate kinase [Oceanobacillus caeni]MBU8789744.1 (d)CMP kinase [Oceanobacillus caeni]MCR1834359.1 (d)CMP kinase [Oceanobacillus caeni]